MENWKMYKETVGTIYYVSDLGNVKSFNKKGCSFKNLKLTAKKTCKYDKLGYLVFGYVENGKRKQEHVHQCVAKLFLKKKGPKKGLEVNHIDGNKHNNKLSNLEWVTRSENTKHAHKLGLIKKVNLTKEKNPNYANFAYDLNLIKKAIMYYEENNLQQKQVAEKFGICRKAFSRYLLHKRDVILEL